MGIEDCNRSKRHTHRFGEKSTVIASEEIHAAMALVHTLRRAARDPHMRVQSALSRFCVDLAKSVSRVRHTAR